MHFLCIFNRLFQKRHFAASRFVKSFDCLCRFFYIVGIQTARILLRFRRRIRFISRPAMRLVSSLYCKTIGRQIEKFLREVTSIRAGTSVAKKRISEAKSKGVFHALKISCKITRKSLVLHKSFIFSILNIIVPVLSVAFLVVTIRYWNGINFGLILMNKGKEIASIKDESVYEKATEMVNQRMVHDVSPKETDFSFSPNFRLAFAGTTGYSTSANVCDLLIQQSNGIIEEASGLYVDGKLLGSVKSGADLRYMLQSLLEKARGGDPSITAQFTQNVEIINGLFPTMSLVSSDAMESVINRTSKSGMVYMVKKGDTVTSIAKANHMTISQLQRINDNKLGDSLQPGELIRLEVPQPVLSVQTVKAISCEMPVSYVTITQNDNTQYTDYSKVLTEGVNGKQKCLYDVYSVDGVETKRVLVSTTILVDPVSKVVLTGTKKKPADMKGIASGNFLWPVPSLHDITTYFTWRWGKFHTGIDISGSSAYGSTIVASDGGTVTLSGQNDGYGNCLIIDHGNGYSTLYGHCSRLLVSEGEKVAKGEAVAKVGSTGNSTGPHCHFEVIKNGEKVNPLQFVG